MDLGHLIVTVFEFIIVLFGAWYINQLNKKEYK